MVGIGPNVDDVGIFRGFLLSVPKGYVSGTALSDSATYGGKTFATLGVRPGTRVWKWGTGANTLTKGSGTLQIGSKRTRKGMTAAEEAESDHPIT
jgi:hypothetical protein